jgi:hypothetical protein
MLTVETVSNLCQAAKARIELQWAAEKRAAGSNYVAALTRAEDVLKQNGNASGWNRVRKEKNRFEEDPGVPDVSSAHLPAAVADAQAEYRRSLAGAEYTRLESQVRALESTLSRLDAAQKNHEAMTQADRVKAAREYRTAIGLELTLLNAKLVALADSRPVKKRTVNPPPR